MRKYLILLAVICTVAACGHRPKTGQRQDVVEVSDAAQSLCGGYTGQRVLTDGERQLFQNVTRESDGVQYTPESVATQVVAGMNYRFICTAKTVSREPETYQAEITVYQPLPGQGDPKITAIKRL